MIFTLSEGNSTEVKIDFPQADLFCFFPAVHSVQIPAGEWWKAVAASLRMKKEVLILEENLGDIHFDPSARWCVGEKFLWLAPRSLSVLLEAAHLNSMSYDFFKDSLKSRK